MRNKISQFFYGRYGVDEYNRFILILETISLIIWWITNWYPFTFLTLFFALYYFFRTLSKNVIARSLENDRYKALSVRIRHRIKAFVSNIRERDYKHFICPNCAQIIRVPRHKGNIEITCPACRTKFDKRT